MNLTIGYPSSPCPPRNLIPTLECERSVQHGFERLNWPSVIYYVSINVIEIGLSESLAGNIFLSSLEEAPFEHVPPDED